MLRLIVIPLCLALASSATAHAQAVVPPAPRYRDVAARLTPWIERLMAQHQVPGLAIALVDDQRVVWARGFGVADPAARSAAPVRADTPFRVASVSKLFTDIAIMQLVERGTLALDSPVTRYAPEVTPRNPFGTPITLRHLLAHRSGLVREPPVGHYFDPSAPSLAATARSLNSTELVYRPGSATKYSNAAIALAGYLVERATGRPFAAYLEDSLLRPMGIAGSFDPSVALLTGRARGTMWTVDARRFPAPTFPLGLGPASELTASMVDLGRFLSMLFAGGAAPGGRVIGAATLASMWNVEDGFGLGFDVTRLDGHRMVRHGGWHYGFGTELAGLPEQRLGVAVSVTMDAANALAERIAAEALRGMLAAREGRVPGSPVIARQPDAATRAALAGRWRNGARGLDLWVRDSTLWMWSLTGGFPSPVRLRGDTLVTDGLLRWGQPLIREGQRLIFGRDTLSRDDLNEAPAERAWRALIGEYGWDHDVLYIHEREGRVYALIEWFALYPLLPSSDPDRFRFPDYGLYAGEEVRFFVRDTRSPPRADSVSVAGVVFTRRDVFPEQGATFRIAPLRPIEELRRLALAARPPAQPRGLRQPDLVELVRLDSTIRLDIRYATNDNFMGARMYESARAFLQRPAAEALVRAHRALARYGYGLLIHDAYRPWYVTKMFWDATPDSQRTFVANPARGSKHNRGAAVDLTLYELRTGRPVPMVGEYDEFSPRSYPDYPGGTSRQRWHRDLLRRVMEAEGFSVDGAEWWHFDYRDWASYPVLNLRFESLAAQP
jgi:CubicO group peptidase (beta-lactamase class C family)/D-alanyl-D-alanine dipeptidase